MPGPQGILGYKLLTSIVTIDVSLGSARSGSLMSRSLVSMRDPGIRGRRVAVILVINLSRR